MLIDAQPRWVAWKASPDPKTGRKRKVPYDPRTGAAADVWEGGTFGTKAEAERMAKRRDFAGIGLVLGGDLHGVDLDGCLDGGSLAPWAREVVERFPTYAEISPSGKGLKLYFKSDDAGFGGRKRVDFMTGDHTGVQVFRDGFFAFTGKPYGSPRPIAPVDRGALDWLIREHGPSLGGTGKPKDESGSGAGFRFMRDLDADSFEEAREAILADDGPAGDWARRVDDRQLERAYENGRRDLIGALPDLPDEPSRATLRLLTVDDCEATPGRPYVIKRLLARHDVACLFAQPGAGKSVLAPFLGYMVAKGASAFGLRTKRGPVLYVAAEDPHGMATRVRALRARYGGAPGFHVVDGVSDLFAPKAPQLDELVALGERIKPALIVIDTIAAAFPGLEENEAKSMGRVVAIARLLARGGAAVLLIHHGTKAEGTTPRGHSILNGALDVAMMLEPGDVIRGALTKNRNGPCDLDVAFAIEAEELGVDDDGDPITAPVCRELRAPLAPKLTKPERAALARLDDGMTEDDWRKACVDCRTVSDLESPKTRGQAVRRAMRGLIEKGVVEIERGIARQAGEAFPDDE